jgi:hypothetical protein
VPSIEVGDVLLEDVHDLSYAHRPHVFDLLFGVKSGVFPAQTAIRAVARQALAFEPGTKLNLEEPAAKTRRTRAIR